MAYTEAVKSRALELLKAGDSSRTVSKVLGVSRHSVQRWAKMVGMAFKQNSYAGGVVGINKSDHKSVLRTQNGLPANGKLGLAERVFIETRLKDDWPIRKIASAIDVHASTVYREIALGKQAAGGDTYLAIAADGRSLNVRQRPKSLKIVSSKKLRTAVRQKLTNRHSPQQIANRLKLDFPNDKELHVSHETIYKAIYSPETRNLFKFSTSRKLLRTGRRKRKCLSRNVAGRDYKSWVNKSPISARPLNVNTRQTVGHWEGDLVIGKGNKSALLSLIERKTRFSLLARLPVDRSSKTVNDTLQELFQDLPPELKLSLTWDQGVEMARAEEFTKNTECTVYFCDPHSPWQRGSNENLNGLVRDFYPKGTDFRTISDDEIAEVQDLLNNRPKRVLEWLTPLEAIQLYLNVS